MRKSDIAGALAQSLVVGIPGPRAQRRDLELFSKWGLGGVILFARNIESPAQVWELNASLRRAAAEAGRPPLLVMVDQEGGSVARLKAPFTHGPHARDLGRTGDADRLRAHGARLGAELLAAGFNWNLAPVLDVHAAPGGMMELRSLSSDPGEAARLGAAFIQGQQAAGCPACAKHFPGLGRTTQDTHAVRPRVDLSREELEAVELVPFRAAVAAGAAGIMVCHAVYNALDPDRPASLSHRVVSDLLRGELGYQGLVLSDDLEMGALAGEMDPARAAEAAYLAGCDLLLVCSRAEMALHALERLTDLADRGVISPQRIQGTAARIAGLKQGLDPLPGRLADLERILARGRGGNEQAFSSPHTPGNRE